MSEVPQSAIDGYKATFGELRRKLVETLGTDTIDLLLERAVREVLDVHPGFRIRRDGGKVLILDWEDDPITNHSDEYIRTAFSALYAALLIILARLLGKEIAVRLASALDADRVLQGEQIAAA
jgi:hypothetical protein